MQYNSSRSSTHIHSGRRSAFGSSHKNSSSSSSSSVVVVNVAVVGVSNGRGGNPPQ